MNKQILFGIFAGISFVFLGYFLFSQVNTTSISGINPPTYTAENETFSYNTNVQNNSSAPVFFGNVTDVVTKDISRGLFTDIQSSIESDSDTSNLIKRIQEEGLNEDILTQDISPQSVGFIENLDQLDVNPSLSNLPSDKTRYLDSIGKTLSQINIENESDEVVSALDSFISGGNDSQLNNLIKKYNIILDNVMNLPVPSEYIDFHEHMVVSLWNFSSFLDAIAHINTDPIRSLVAVEYFDTIQQQWNDFATFLNMIQ